MTTQLLVRTLVARSRWNAHVQAGRAAIAAFALKQAARLPLPAAVYAHATVHVAGAQLSHDRAAPLHVASAAAVPERASPHHSRGTHSAAAAPAAAPAGAGGATGDVHEAVPDPRGSQSASAVDGASTPTPQPPDPTTTTPAANGGQLFFGPYAQTRARLDFTWHVHYPQARQQLQDAIVSEYLATGAAVGRPMAVYVAGPMGSGKSHVIRSLAEQQLFRLDRFVYIDSDRIKFSLPETARYISENRQLAATKVHKESAHIAEIIEREALRRQKNLLVDGSLRDIDWYRGVFRRIRSEWPHYRIMLLAVTAPREVIYARAAKRAQVTGRVVPRELLDEAFERAPHSYQALAPLADFSAVIDNASDDGPPTLVPPATVDCFRRLFWEEPARDSCADNVTGPPATPILLRPLMDPPPPPPQQHQQQQQQPLSQA